jgi:Flp pilus assembly protein TadD
MTGELQARARRRLGLKPGAGWVSLALALSGGVSASAQSLPVVSHPVVQPLPSENGAGNTATDPARMLSNALGRVGRNPRDGEALTEAGNAALTMGDANAAAGFYARANQILPGNPKVAAGWAEAKMRGDDPIGAIPLYDEAAQGGALTGDLLSDRGLAHDLVGDNAAAQRSYREALAKGASDEAVRRLALSEAIGGDRKAMETTLAPLLQKQDRAAWRTRAFAFAILGREDEAVAIARSTMPAEMANGMAPFLRFMRKLTPAQQAAAANLGRFPHASEIGKDDPRILAYATQHGVKHMAAVDAPLVPSGAPLGAAPVALARRDESRSVRKKVELAEAAPAPRAEALPPEPNPSREVSPPPALASATPAPPRREVEPKSAPPAANQAPGFGALATAEKPRTATGGFDLARLPAGEAPAAPRTGPVPEASEVARATVHAAPPPPAPRAAPKGPPRKASFAEAFSAWGAAEEKHSEAPASGAVDLRKIKPRRPAPPPPPPPPPNPSRVWVQVGVGRQPARIAFDWRRMTREDPKLFAGRKAWTSDWGRTNRVLVGPFDDEDEAKAFVGKAKKAGHDDTFVWLSPAGQGVDPL